jgi:hypothetical protein
MMMSMTMMMMMMMTVIFAESSTNGLLESETKEQAGAILNLCKTELNPKIKTCQPAVYTYCRSPLNYSRG